MSSQPPILPTPPPPMEDRAELGELPWTAIAVIVAIVGLFFFMAFPMNGPSPARRLAAQRERVAFLALEQLQNAVEDYRGDHGVWPGLDPNAARSFSAPTYSAETLRRQLGLYSDPDGATLPTHEGEYSYGPYLPNGIPSNAKNGLNSVRLLQPGESFGQVLDGVYGWLYDPLSGEVRRQTLPFQRPQSRQVDMRHDASRD